MTEPEWYRANRANWDERVGVHIGPGGYDLSELRAGRGKLNAIEEAELPPVEGKRVAHLQCHFGADSLTLAQRGAEVVGLDFSAPAIEVARKLADELGLANRARFVHADLYDALAGDPDAPSVRHGVRHLGRHLLAARHLSMGADRRGAAASGRIALSRRRPSHRLRLR